ncbi:MAG TPA: alginate lyase family protein [Terracidiphilus sp.]|jgi:poly(beta-D-mannuronate) lyase|nr:alginate lyase family protein [Terracidiphilus sp.]
MRRILAPLAVLLFLATLAPICNAEKPLRSPWDSLKVQVTDAPYACPAPIHIPADLTTSGFYGDSKGSIIDPVKWKAYQQSAGPVKDLGIKAVAAADAFRATGSRQAAQCVLMLEKTAALDHALTGKMSSSQAYFVQGWVAGALAIALLKVRDSGVVDRADTRLIADWLKTVTQQTMDFYDKRDAAAPGGNGNNHLYWAGVQVGAVAIAGNNRKLFNWAVAAYRNGIRQITPQGTLPEEMRRGQRALHYHLYAASPLVYLAEFGEDNGIDLYGEDNQALKRLVDRSIAGLDGSGYFDKVTGIKQDLPDGPPSAEAIGWAKVYVHRFPDPAISALLAKAPSLGYMYLGGLPPY